jgi:predicted alpha-1,2-mannosidase
VESNPYQQHWFVPHDVDGLIALMGRETFIRKLDELFSKSPAGFQWNDYYNHSNEPVHHAAYLFNRAGVPGLTQKWVRTVLKQAYDVGPYGLCGNDDVGQMSAWYIFSAMGFYPICPGDNTYDIGSPLFDKVELRTGAGRAFTVRAIDNSPQNVYVQSATLNGKPLAGLRLRHGQIVGGGELQLRMGARPAG